MLLAVAVVEMLLGVAVLEIDLSQLQQKVSASAPHSVYIERVGRTCESS